MKSIWLYFEVVCSLKSFSWNVEVKPSKARNPPRSAKPYVLLPWSEWLEMGPVIKNSTTPPVTAKAIIQSVTLKRFPDTAMPQIMTGIILKLLPSICTGKLTYLRASYWQVLAYTFEKEIAKYFQRGAPLMSDSPLNRAMATAKTTATARFMKTRNTESVNSTAFFPCPYG